MLLSFIKYFFHYIFFAKTRQRLLYFAIVGLLLSSFALLVLQSVMGGLQNGLVKRSQSVEGSFTVILKNKEETFASEVLKDLRQQNLEAYAEYEIELLIRHDQYVSPVVVHGVLDFEEEERVPPFLRDKERGKTILGFDLVRELRADFMDPLTLISPSHIQSLLGEIPRQISTQLDDIINTDIPEVDRFHLWTRLSLVQNLIREHHLNRIRVYTPISEDELTKLKISLQQKYPGQLDIKSWEEQNSSLVWALNLETSVMVFLFIVMTFLVMVSITSGFLIFFDKVKRDLVSFWILGASEKKINWGSIIFIHTVSLVSISVGLLLGFIFLYILDKYATNIMPDMFVDRGIPVLITWKGILSAFFIPYLISTFFSHLTLKNIQKNRSSFLNVVRAVGS